jgi:hypothetical protein
MQSPYHENPALLPDDQNELDFQCLLDSFNSQRINPFKADTFHLAERLTQVTHKISSTTVTHDKEQISLNPFITLATFSDMTKASIAFNYPRVGNQSQEPDYPTDFSASRADVVICGLRHVYLPSGEDNVSSTGVPFDPSQDGFDTDFKAILSSSVVCVAKAQQVMLNMLRYEIDDGMFPILNKTFPASDLLHQLWMFLAS